MLNYKDIINNWQKLNISNDAELSAALNSHCINFAYNSGKIENDKITYHDTREIFENDGVVKYTGDLRTLFEIRNAKDAYELLLIAFNEKRPIDENLIKEFQEKLTKNTYDTRRYQLGERPGEYKKHDYVTGKEEVGALPEDVSEEINELLSEIKDIPDDKALIAAAYFHAKFENIHPFADGNGRTGRLLMNYILLIHNHPPVIIFQEDRNEYYNALEKWDTIQDLTSLKDFLESQIIKTWQKRVEKQERINKKKDNHPDYGAMAEARLQIDYGDSDPEDQP